MQANLFFSTMLLTIIHFFHTISVKSSTRIIGCSGIFSFRNPIVIIPKEIYSLVLHVRQALVSLDMVEIINSRVKGPQRDQHLSGFLKVSLILLLACSYLGIPFFIGQHNSIFLYLETF